MRGPSDHTNVNSSPWILLVDDDNELREGLAEALADRGMVTRQARNGREALTVIRSCMANEVGAPAAIVLDLMMPQLDGWGFAKEMDADPALRGIPVVVANAFGHLTRAQAIHFGSLPPPPVIAKPYDVETLIKRLRDVCGQL